MARGPRQQRLVDQAGAVGCLGILLCFGSGMLTLAAIGWAVSYMDAPDSAPALIGVLVVAGVGGIVLGALLTVAAIAVAIYGAISGG